MHTHHRSRAALGAIAASLTASLLIGMPSSARAEFGPEVCLSQRAKAWGSLRACERNEDAKAILGRSSDRVKCQVRFGQTMAAIETRATPGGVACRYRDNLDGTVTDLKTGLMWAKLTPIDGVPTDHLLDGDNRYDWRTALELTATLNGIGVWPGTSITPVPGNAGYTDWRLPNILELATIRDPTVPWCGSNYAGCTDPIFGPTFAGGYLSSSVSSGQTHVWLIHFGSPTAMMLNAKEVPGSFRPVRSAF